MQRLLILALLFCAPPLHAGIPSIDERSPFRPGLWWNPDHAGTGLDIQRAGDGVFLVWYTHRGDGSPVWYTAQGPMEDGQFDAAVLEHRWADGAPDGFEIVGSLAFEALTPESLRMAFELPEGAGEWMLKPFLVDGTLPEVDHSGAWFQPDRPGYGLTLGHQGEFLFAAVYLFDGEGRPVWAVGENAWAGTTLPLNTFRGACPSCPHRAAESAPAGSLVLRLGDGRRMEVDLDAMAGDARWNLFAQPLEILTRPAAERAADRMLVRLAREEALGEQIRRGLLALHGTELSRFGGGVDFSASPPPGPVAVPAYSETNVQEAGVDEAALLVTDGRLVFAQAQRLQPQPPRIRVGRLAEDGSGLLAAPREFTVFVDPAIERPAARGMLLDEARLVVIHGEEMHAHVGIGLWFSPWPWVGGRFQVDILPRHGDDLGQSSWRAVIDGHLLAARRVGDQLLLMHRHTPSVAGLRFASSDPDHERANRELLDAIDVAGLLPQIRVAGVEPAPLIDADRVLLPPVTDRVPRPDLMLLTRIDLTDPEDRETLAVIGYLEAFHVAPEAVWLASSRYQPEIDAQLWLSRPGMTTTELHRFALVEGRLAYSGSGSVEGFLHWEPDRAAFQMSEHAGRLRVLTQSFDDGWGEFGRHRLSVLEPSQITPGLMRTLAQLPNRSRPEPIGKPGEMLYGTRFVGDRLYAVTFLAIDPLYVIDLADPADPFIAGEVELPGFSDYLHPLPGGLLLGFGQDAIEEIGWGGLPFAWFQGNKLSLFDVSDPARPEVLQEIVLGKRGSTSALLEHHHAFSILHGDGVRPTRFAIPMALHGEGMPRDPNAPPSTLFPWTRSGLFRFELTGEGRATRIRTLDPLITRAAAQGDSVDGHDGGRRGGRALLFEGGSLYVDRDRFWSADWASPPELIGPH
jgi:hypothetical protein